MTWPDDLLHAWRVDHRRWLLLAACCAPDVDVARASWEELSRRFDDEIGLLAWLTVGPPRRALPYLGSRTSQLAMSPDVQRAAKEATAEAWALNESVFATARTVVGIFTEAGIEVMALKGLALAGETYRPHRLRAVGDLDLLVHPRDHRRSVEILEADGWRREPGDPLPRPGTAAIMVSRPGSAFLDIHSRPARTLPFRRGRDPQCWQDAQLVGVDHPLAGLALLRPSIESLLVIQACHAVLGANVSLVHPLLDICRILSASADGTSDALDIERLITVADANGARGRLRAVLKLVVQELGVPGPADIPAESRRARRRELKVHRADVRVSRQEGGALPSLGRALGYIRVGTVGQGLSTTIQMMQTVLASKRDRHQGSLTDEPAPLSPSEPIPVVVIGSVFGVAEDGKVVEIRWSDPSMLTRIQELWPPLGLESSKESLLRKPTTLIRVTGDSHSPTVSVGDELRPDGWDAVESALALFAAEHLSHLIAIHAAVFVRRGRAVIVPGASHAGKSTLAVAAHEAGAIVASDEYALIDPTTGHVRGWNRPVRLRTPQGIKKLPIAQDIGPVPVALVAAVRFSTDDPEIRPMTQAETAFALLANTVCAQTRPEESLRAATCVTRSAQGVTGTRRETVDFLPHLLSGL